jgi:DNA polymerase-3 subunit delta
LLEKLKDQQDAMMILAMVQRQFRLLLQAREVLDGGGDEREITKQLKLHPFVSGKLNNQARRFNLLELEMVYRRLLDLDEGIKTGQIVADLALDTFVAAFTNQ